MDRKRVRGPSVRQPCPSLPESPFGQYNIWCLVKRSQHGQNFVRGDKSMISQEAASFQRYPSLRVSEFPMMKSQLSSHR
jgi:hypothetical protein